MSLMVPNEGKIYLLDQMRFSYWWSVATLIPYTNDVTPGPGSVIADFATNEAAGLGPRALGNFEQWTAAAIVDGRAQTQRVSPAEQWTLTGSSPVTVYGYLVRDEEALYPLWVERFTAPIVMQPGGTLQILPVLTLGSEY